MLLFHCNNGCTNAPQCYVIRILPVLYGNTCDDFRRKWHAWRTISYTFYWRCCSVTCVFRQTRPAIRLDLWIILNLKYIHIKCCTCPRPLGHMGETGRNRLIVSLILNLGSRQRWVVNNTCRPVYPRYRKEAGCVPLSFWTFGRDTIFATVSIRASDPPARGLVSSRTTQLRFSWCTSKWTKHTYDNILWHNCLDIHETYHLHHYA